MTGLNLIDTMPYPSVLRMGSSKFGDYMTCERKYFLERVLGWAPIDPVLHFEFGTAFHLAKEYLRINGFREENVDSAMDAFSEHYDQYYPGFEWEDVNAPKNKDGATTALLEIIERYGSRERNRDLLYTEVLFKIPVRDDRIFWGRMDAIYHEERGIVLDDDKTSGWDTDANLEQWHLSFQVSAYIFAAVIHAASNNPVWSGNDVWGLQINMTVLKRPLSYNKDGSLSKRYKDPQFNDNGAPYRHKHHTIGIRKSREDLQSFLFEVNDKWDSLDRDFERLSHCTDSDPVMKAFPRRPKHCIQFNKPCLFFSYCHATNNPLQYPEPPSEFKVDHYDVEARKNKAEMTKDGEIKGIEDPK